jgi:2-oxoglutarate dehydrogenase E2 component (dihydrolipoamide succinyltransferase)
MVAVLVAKIAGALGRCTSMPKRGAVWVGDVLAGRGVHWPRAAPDGHDLVVLARAATRKTRARMTVARIDVVMPQMGVAEGTLSKWLKKVGDSVKRATTVFEISTDKVDAEIPALRGRIAEILVKEGQTVPVDAGRV